MSKIAHGSSEAQGAPPEAETPRSTAPLDLETVPDAVVVIDRHGFTQPVSTGVGRLFGFTACATAAIRSASAGR
jgi:hypothetical protein